MKRKPRISSTFLALFAVIFIMVAAFPANVLAAKASVTIRNASLWKIRVGAYDGNDPLCAVYHKEATYIIGNMQQTRVECGGGTKGGCQVWATIASNNVGVEIDGKPTSSKHGCNNAIFVKAGRVLTCKDRAWPQPKADEVYCK